MSQIYKMNRLEIRHAVSVLPNPHPNNLHQILQQIRDEEDVFYSSGVQGSGSDFGAQYSFLLPDQAREELDAILESYNTDTDTFLYTFDSNLRDKGYPWPWVTVCFPHEYNLGAFFRALRGEASLRIFASYSGDNEKTGCILFYEPSQLEAFRYHYPPLEDAWHLLENCKIDDHWFCFTDPSQADWLLTNQANEWRLWESRATFGDEPPQSIAALYNMDINQCGPVKKLLRSLVPWVEGGRKNTFSKGRTMGIWSSIFGGRRPSKNDLIRALAKQRVRQDPMALAMGFDERKVDSLGMFQLAGPPESTIATIVETYASLKKHEAPDNEIFERIEAHGSILEAAIFLPRLTLSPMSNTA